MTVLANLLYTRSFMNCFQYSYLLAVPILLVYTTGFAVIKYTEGYIVLPSGAGVYHSISCITVHYHPIYSVIYEQSSPNRINYGLHSIKLPFTR